MNIVPWFVQPQFWLGVAVVGIFWFLYRFYLRVGRRCKRCGCVWRVRRMSKLKLAPDESISPFSTKRKLRWWIRRVESETFSICNKCGRRESVKITRHPISLWHAWWAWIFHREQYWEDPNLAEVSSRAAFHRRQGVDRDLAKNSEHDTPPLILPWDEPGQKKD